MAEQAQLPNQDKINGFASKLKSFRDTLPQDEQPMLDAMVAAAFQQEAKPAQGDVQGYWWVRAGGYPGWYGAPAYYGTPWATYYGYGYPVYYP
jgi:hypothetical protein